MSRPKPFPRALLSLVSFGMAFRPYERAIRLPDGMTLQVERQNVSKKRIIGLGSAFLYTDQRSQGGVVRNTPSRTG